MANSLESFKGDLAKFAEAVDKTKAEATRMIVLELHEEFTIGNPVDTGYSRANWNVTIAAPSTTPRGARPAKGAAKGEQPLAFPAVDLSIVKAIDGKEKVFVTNPVDYVRFLEDGSSEQAPSGFIAIGIARVEEKVDTIIQRAVREAMS